MKIAIIGCGSIGQRHARNLHELGIKDLLLVDSQIERTASVASELDAKVFDVAAKAYEEKPEVAVICAPTSMHLRLAQEALQNNCHLFIEKPLSDSMDGVLPFVNAAEARKRVMLVGYNFRFDPIVNQVQEWLSQGKIGRVTSARFHFGSYLPWRHPWEDYRSGYGARRDLGGGAILDAIHELDIALLLFGKPEVIYCAGGKYSDLEMDAEDLAEILMSYPNKIVSVHLDFIERPAARWYEIIGTQGRIEADLFSRTAKYFDGEKRQWTACDKCGTLEESYKSEMQHLLDCVAGKAKPIVDGRAGAESLLLAEQVKASMQAGLPIVARGAALAAGAK
jgi:predicted dehydrogenase